MGHTSSYFSMHENARLATDFPLASKQCGEIVSISEVAEHYATSGAANSALKFVCADPRCAVPASAVIVQPFKPGRKFTPSSSFRANDKGRPQKCDRLQPLQTSTEGSGEGGSLAHPYAGEATAIWVDPLKQKTSAESAGQSAVSKASGEAGERKGIDKMGASQSKRRSETVERFARDWSASTVVQRHAQKLVAPWNPGGTYFSAFHPLHFWPSVASAGTKIFVGTARTVDERRSGFYIELNEFAEGPPRLRLWFGAACLETPASGPALVRVLRGLVEAGPSDEVVRVFALGRFSEFRLGGSEWHSLEVLHPHMVWINREPAWGG